MSILDCKSSLVARYTAAIGRISHRTDLNRINEMSEVGAEIIVARCINVQCNECPAREAAGECPVCGSVISDHNIRQHMLNPCQPVRCICGAVMVMCAGASVCGISVPRHPLMVDHTKDDII